MLVVLAAIPVLIAIAVRVHSSGGSGRGDTGAAFFANITDNGIFVSLAAMLVIVPLFLPMVVSVVSGDCLAGEANSGTLRYLLTVPVGRTREMIAAIKKAGGTPKYTELPGVGHDSWTKAYTDPDGVIPWLFEQKKGK